MKKEKVAVNGPSYGLKRQETFQINAVFKCPVKNKKVMKIVLPMFGVDDRFLQRTLKDDTIDISYKFDIEYFGNIVERFEAFLKLCEEADLVKMDTKEIQHGRCLIQELLCKFEQVEQKYGGK